MPSGISYLRHDSSPPPPQLCAQINEDIRSNPILDSPYFDLVGHVENRVYCIHKIDYGDALDETAAILDVGVKALLSEPLSPRIESPKGTFEIRKAGGRGFGMFALQDIPAGALILVERPIIVGPYIIGLGNYSESDIYAALLRRLSPDTTASFMALANCKPPSECDTIEGIMRTNGIAINLSVPDVPHPELSTHRAVFLNTSRCNHSCGPNAKWTWDPTSFSLSLAALRPILAGDEITVTYMTPTHSFAERRERLRAQYNFACHCAVCTHTTHSNAVPASDAARAELRAFWARTPSFEAWCGDSSLPDHALIDAHKRALLLIEQEGLQVLGCGRHLDAIAMGYGALRDVAQFRAWSGRARECRFAEERGDAVRVLERWIDEPETFPVWGWRKSLKGSRRA
ncbi:hypothetical protein B0H10DRAFT_1775631 [Mycena sp. CBHHK59/15]|nr:hypothetical protein B0H10DRAFT_1775631 [Mycena sp. CBHHK59/15]